MISSTGQSIVRLILKTIFIIKHVHFKLNNLRQIKLFCEVEQWDIVQEKMDFVVRMAEFRWPNPNPAVLWSQCVQDVGRREEKAVGGKKLQREQADLHHIWS